MRIYKNKYYILESIPGISGFQRWNEREYRVATGWKAQYDKIDVVQEFHGNGKGQFRLEDGHLPDYQPTVDEEKIFSWLDNDHFSTAFIKNPEVYGLNKEV